MEPEVAHRTACQGFAGQDLKSHSRVFHGAQSTDHRARKLQQNELSRWLSGKKKKKKKKSTYNAGRHRFNSWVAKNPWRRKQQV